MINIKTKIGLRIKELRNEASMTQKDLAFAADLDRSYIASIENGRRNVSIVNIEKIAIALNVTPMEFFQNERFDNY